MKKNLATSICILSALVFTSSGCAEIARNLKRSMGPREFPTARRPLKSATIVSSKRTTYEPEDRGGAEVDEDNKVIHDCGKELPETVLTVSTNARDEVCLTHRFYTWNQTGYRQDEFRHTQGEYRVWTGSDSVTGDYSEYRRLDLEQPPEHYTTCQQRKMFGASDGPVYQVYEQTLSGCFEGHVLTAQTKILMVFRGMSELGGWQFD